MRRRLALALPLLALACVAAAAPTVVAASPQDPQLPTDVPMAGADFPGAPPAFLKPDGGKVSVDPQGGGVVQFTLTRADGTLFAQATMVRGRTVDVQYYDADGSPGVEASAYYDDSAFPGASHPFRPAPMQHRNARCGAAYWYDPIPARKLSQSSYFTWYFNAASTPSYLSIPTTETYLRNAHHEWDVLDNWCGIADQSNYLISYGGQVGSVVFGNNGVNTVGFGDVASIGCASNALACTMTWPKTGSLISESDTRLNSAVTWVNGQASGKYDVWSVMAHEFGHSTGLGDVTNSADNGDDVMYYSFGSNNASNEKLGNGDAQVANLKY
jgi:hypothetical protein